MNLTTALARLLTDPQLRQQFRHDRQLVVEQFGIKDPDRAALIAMDIDDLDRQAVGLLNKRFYEIRRLIPRTIDRLGPDARATFDRYAVDHWPTGHRRHWIDAAKFCEWLAEHHHDSVCRAELNGVRFELSERRWAVFWVNDLMVGGQPQVAVQWFTRRDDGQVRYRYFHLGRWSGIVRHFANAKRRVPPKGDKSRRES